VKTAKAKIGKKPFIEIGTIEAHRSANDTDRLPHDGSILQMSAILGLLMSEISEIEESERNKWSKEAGRRKNEQKITGERFRK
jgi:hypothetical protein